MQNRYSTIHELTDTELQYLAPAIFAESGSDRTSSRYIHIPTAKLVETFRQLDYVPVRAYQSHSRACKSKLHTAHVIKFWPRNAIADAVAGVNLNKYGQSLALLGQPEMSLYNEHNGGKSYELAAGYFRTACANGLLAVSNCLPVQKVRHCGNVERVQENVAEGITHTAKLLPAVTGQIEQFRAIQLSKNDRTVLAQAAALQRWNMVPDEITGAHEEVNLTNLLMPKRRADTGTDLWTTFNVLQENVIRGGCLVQRHKADGTATHQLARAINSVKESNRINQALWQIAEYFAKNSNITEA